MLKLYHSPISPNSRRVWITLLEKNVEFELIEVNLSGEQFQPQFLALNPFHHIPVLVEDDFRIVESLAMLDYLEAKYPLPAMLPKEPKDLAIARMVQLTTVNELLPATFPLVPKILGVSTADSEQTQQAQQKVTTVLQFFESLLDDRPYFGSESLTVAEVVAGTLVPALPSGGVPLDDFPKLQAWCDRLVSRPSWQATEATPEDLEALKALMTMQTSP